MLGNNLIKKKGLTVITTAVNIARQLSSKKDFLVILTGGILDSETHSLTGHLAEESFKRIHADIAFIACDSISQTLKVMYTSFEISELMKTILEAAVVKVLIADHSKFGKVDIASIGSIAQFDKLVVDSQLADDYVKKIRDLGVEVIT
jgi:DeoR/GlpR family transcriptional regulator of sugar metabolism